MRSRAKSALPPLRLRHMVRKLREFGLQPGNVPAADPLLQFASFKIHCAPPRFVEMSCGAAATGRRLPLSEPGREGQAQPVAGKAAAGVPCADGPGFAIEVKVHAERTGLPLGHLVVAVTEGITQAAAVLVR